MHSPPSSTCDTAQKYLNPSEEALRVSYSESFCQELNLNCDKHMRLHTPPQNNHLCSTKFPSATFCKGFHPLLSLSSCPSPSSLSLCLMDLMASSIIQSTNYLLQRLQTTMNGSPMLLRMCA